MELVSVASKLIIVTVLELVPSSVVVTLLTCAISLDSFLHLATSEKPNSGGRQRQGGRFNDRERFNDRDRDHTERQGERLDNRPRQNDDRPSRGGGRGGGRPRLSSREKDRVSTIHLDQS